LLAVFELWSDVRLERIANIDVLLVLSHFVIGLWTWHQVLNGLFEFFLNLLLLLKFNFKRFDLVLG